MADKTIQIKDQEDNVYPEIINDSVKTNAITSSIHQYIYGKIVLVKVDGAVTRIASNSQGTIGTISESAPKYNVRSVISTGGDIRQYALATIGSDGAIKVSNRTSTSFDWLYGTFVYII